MKVFNKLLILKWHYIEHEMIELGNINFLTGKNASGKSTIIDAMQVILLGDTSGHIFNKSANEKSRRTLLSYVKGELTDNEEAGFNYLRNDDFTSIIAMQAYDNLKNKYFTIGIQIDMATDNTWEKSFFILDGKIPENHFILDGNVMNIRELKDFSDRNKVKLDQYRQNNRYREALLGKLGNVNNKYFSLFKKAVPFTPITDIKGFITEFICDTDKKVDIVSMQNNIRYYERMKLEAEDIEKRIKVLENIQENYKEYNRLRDLEKLHGYIVDKAREQSAIERIDSIESNIKNLEKEISKKKEEYEENKRKVDNLNYEKDSINKELSNSAEYNRDKEYREKIKDLNKKIKENEDTRDRIINKLKQRIGSWNYRFSELEIQKENCEMKAFLDKLEELMSLLNENDIGKLDYDVLCLINKKMKKKIENYNIKQYKVESDIEAKKDEKANLQQEIVNLKKGKKGVEERIINLKNLISNELSTIYNKKVDVELICDLIEIKNEKWQDAIEGYLHTQKFYLYIEPKYFIEGLKIYERYKNECNIYGVGLIDIEKVREKQRSYVEGSLAEEIQTDNYDVRQYINYLLGRVMKVDDVSQLRNHRVSITVSCMLYKNYVARQINPRRYEIPFIGVRAIKRQLEVKRQEEIKVEEELKGLKKKENDLKEICKLRDVGEDIIDEFYRRKIDINLIPSDKKILIDWQQKLSEIDASNFIMLKRNLEELDNSINDINDKMIEIKSDSKTANDKIHKLKNDDIKVAKYDKDKCTRNIEDLYDKEWIISIGQPKYEQELKRLITSKLVIDNFKSSKKRFDGQIKNQWLQLANTRQNYIREFQGTFNINDKSNEAYDKLLTQLSETDLPKYKGKIDDAIKTAQQEFKDDFLSKLKYNIDVVTGQIKELNAALKSMSFGKDSYAFKVTPNTQYKKYYEMITDPRLMGEFTIFSGVFQDKYKDVMGELFKKIIDVGEGALSVDEREEMEINIKKYTDYRTYLDFDLVVTDTNGRKSHLSKMITKKSGGETQTPFYISVLASFYRIYRMNAKKNDTSRLIIFDEAFSKMDHERIAVCIKLLRDLGFQALISAPTEKVANIAPIVDKTLGVIRTSDRTFVKAFTKKELNDVI